MVKLSRTVPLKSIKSKTTPSVKLRDKVKVKLGGRWKPGRVVEITHNGRVAHVELETDAEHRTVYASVDTLRPNKI